MNLSRVAIKQLTASDLTFFASQFHKPGQRSKQKAINLNADVFVSQFYPGLRDRFTEVHFGLTIVGPAGARPYVLSRKAIRSEGAKNWRLNGELINDPPEEEGRFAQLAENDVAILSFEGAEQPERAVMVLVSARDDTDLYRAISALGGFEGRHTMRPVAFKELESLFRTTRVAYRESHPLEVLLSGDTLEEVVYGSAQSQEAAVNTDGLGLIVSPETVRRRANEAGVTGQLGEEAFEEWLIQSGHDPADFQWVSQTYARAAYDFKIASAQWEHSESPLFVDVKTTRSAHEAPLHLTMSEIRWAAAHTGYRIARISSLTEASAEVRILGDVSRVCAALRSSLSGLPSGVSVDSIEIQPSLFSEIARSHILLGSQGTGED